MNLIRSSGRRGVPELGTTAEILKSVGRGDQPVVLMLTCSELRMCPDQIAHTRPGEVVVIQNPAGRVPAWEAEAADGLAASISYGLSLPTVKHLVVCGHRRCRFASSSVRRALAHAGRSASARWRERSSTTMRGNSHQVVEHLVLEQLGRLRDYPEVRERLDEGDLLLHGWVYDDSTARIHPCLCSKDEIGPL